MRISPLPVVFVSLALFACTPATPTSPEVVIDIPPANSMISSPLTVKGKAKGTWFFEASLPVLLLDSEGNQLDIQPAQAKGEWMTPDFVEFETTLNYTTTDTSGWLVVRKDNPSGLPENDAEYKIPVIFGE